MTKDQHTGYRDQWKQEIEGHAPLRQLHEELRQEIRERHQRSLPFGEELFDRWERARFLGFETGASIYDSCIVIGDVRVGEQTWIGPFSVLDGSGGLSIGKFCSIAAGVQIYTHDTVQWALTGGKQPSEREAVTISDCAYIGPNAIIAKGVSVGRHCVVGAASLVTRSIPDFSIAHGCPARVVGRVELSGDCARLVYD